MLLAMLVDGAKLHCVCGMVALHDTKQLLMIPGIPGSPVLLVCRPRCWRCKHIIRPCRQHVQQQASQAAPQQVPRPQQRHRRQQQRGSRQHQLGSANQERLQHKALEKVQLAYFGKPSLHYAWLGWD